ncbi:MULTISPECIES: DUF2232 domain-containing protein [Rhodomicrobium]|uniref:DUF2232 domain-containing protein n=1 Tax=Rhodomicrobium TaxID=1068 RepID=UPI000B4A8214|nr:MULTISPECIES: DUF2232 domain-containing protein [Rhodomicrobium]
MASPRLIGIGSGLVAAVLFTSLANNSALALMLFYLTPLPVLLAGIGWGLLAALIALVTATLIVSFALGIQTAIAFILYVGLPGVILSYLLLLHREAAPAGGPGGTVAAGGPAIEWYPLGRIIAWAAVMAGGLVALGLVLLGGDGEGYRAAVRSMFDDNALTQLQGIFGAEFGQVEFDRFIERFTRYILPAFAATFWLLVMIGNLWLAAKSASISGQLNRPVPSFSQINYPPLFVAAFFAALGLSFSPGGLGLAGMAFLGAFGCAFLILGVAVVHSLVAGTQLKPALLVILYAGLLLTPWFAPIVTALGLAEPFLHLRQRVQRPTPPAGGRGPNS